jgi:FkbM family methyltransferase
LAGRRKANLGKCGDGMTDRLVLEVGAGDGSSAWEFAKMPGVIVQTFEPSTTMRGIAYERLRGIPNVTVFPYAVGGTDRQAELYRCNGSAASLHKIGEPHERCTVVSMNHLFVTFRIAEIDTLILDCNGSEYEILEQMLDCDRMRQVRELRIVWNGDEPERKATICAAIARTHEPPDKGANWERKV